MADEQLGATLDLDISSALASIGDLTSQLDAALQLTPEIDTSAIEPAISEAVSAADTTVPLDASGADTITGDIDSAVAAADATVPINGDPGDAEAAITEVAATAESTDATITVAADTNDAQSAIDDLGSAADNTGQKMTGAASSTHQFGAATEAVGAAAGLAVGSTGELSSAAAGLGGAFGPAAIGVAAVGAGIGELASKGIEATGALQRFNSILGPTAAAMNTINVGSLNIGLAELGNKLGTTETQMRNTAASLFQFGINSGASRTAADTFGESIIALSARAVALNPSLGTVADAADSLGVRIARGGRFAAQFGIDLTAADINARALADTGKTTAADLSIYEKAAAGAALATEKYGGSLAGSVVTGSQNAVIQSRNLKVAFDEALVSIGKPLVVPLFDVIRAGIPVATAFGTVLGQLGTAVLPAVATALAVVGPALQVVGASLQVIEPIVVSLGAGFLAFEATATVFAIATGGGAIALDALAAAGTFASIAIDALSIAIETNPIGVLAAAAAVAATAFGLFGGSAGDATDKMKSLGAEMDKLTGKDLVAKFAEAAGVLDNLGLSASEHARAGLAAFKTVADENVGTAQRLLTALQAAGENTDGYAAILHKAVASEQESAQAKRDSAAATDSLVGKTQTAAAAITTQASSTDAVASALAGYASGTTSAADANTALSNAVSVLTADLDLLFGRFLDSDTATNNFKLDIIKLGEQLLATGFTFDDNTQKGLENQNALESAGKAAGTAAEAIRNAGGSVGEQTAPFESFRTSLVNIRTALQAAGQDTSFIDGMIRNTDDAIAAVQGKVPDAQAAGQALGDGVSGGINASAPGVAAAAVGAASNAANAATGAVGAAFGAGQALSEGMAAGVRAAAQGVVDAAVGVAAAAIAGAKGLIKSSSPSAVTRDEIGIPFSQGIALGITAGIPEITKAAEAALTPALDVGKTSVAGAAGTFTPAVTAGPGPQQLALSSASIDQLAAAIAQRSGQTGGRGTGIFIEHATFGSQGAAADMDFWAQVTTARV